MANHRPASVSPEVSSPGAISATSNGGLSVHMRLARGTFQLHAEFDVPAGLTVLLGPSGAGKSLTLRAVAGIQPIDAGTIILDGRPLSDAGARIALPPGARNIGYVPQASALFPHLTVAGNVTYALDGAPPRFDRKRRQQWRVDHAARVAELLALVRLPGRADQSARYLSGGEAQRVALARALAARPDMLLLDEPLGALDAPTRAALRDDLRAVLAASGTPALVVTHDLAEARAIADRLVVLIGGKTIAQGPIDSVLATPPNASSARLLGWRNVLPIAAVRRESDLTAYVTLRSGATVLADLDASMMSDEPAAVALAMRADRLELVPQCEPVGWPHSGMVAGTLVAAGDLGTHYELRVALGRVSSGTGMEMRAATTEEHDMVVLVCSPREWRDWAAAGLGVGGRVCVHVPPGASRLVWREEVAAHDGD